MKRTSDEQKGHKAAIEKPKGSVFLSFHNLTASEVETKGNAKELTYPNGAVYKGECNGQNQKHGKGVFVDERGNVFEGEFRNDKINGRGKYTTTEGTVYDGAWVDDLQEGGGKETWPDGSFYVGDYKQGLKQGKGFYKWEDGSEFNGEWVNGNIEGKVDLLGRLPVKGRLHLRGRMEGKLEARLRDLCLRRRKGL